MDDDAFRPPSRERFREERRALKSVSRRQRLLRVPLVAAGLALVGAGTYQLVGDDDTSGIDVPVDVQGTSVERSTTTSTTSTTTSTTTTTLPPTTLPPTTIPPTTVKKRVVPKATVAPTTAPADTVAETTVAPPVA